MRIELVQGDITEQHVDAIVNAANSSLSGGGGVDGAIHRAGGKAILAECRELRASRLPEGLPTGQAVATTAGRLPARWVVHTVGPVHAAGEDRSDLLASCYRESLRVAEELGARSVAFPAVSTGVYRWPMDDAARIALNTVRFTPSRVEEARFVLFGADAHTAFVNALEATGPADEDIAAALARGPEHRWRRLFEIADSLTAEDLDVEWGGGQRTESGAIQAPYPRYSEPVEEIRRLLSELGVVVAFDWASWMGVSPVFPRAEGLAEAPVAEACRLATAYLRGERFTDGAIEQAIDNGALRAILDRLRRWHDDER